MIKNHIKSNLKQRIVDYLNEDDYWLYVTLETLLFVYELVKISYLLVFLLAVHCKKIMKYYLYLKQRQVS